MLPQAILGNQDSAAQCNPRSRELALIALAPTVAASIESTCRLSQAWVPRYYPTPENALSALANGVFCAVLLDWDATSDRAISCIRELKTKVPMVPITVIASCAGPNVCFAIRAGAIGFLLKPMDTWGIISALEKVLHGATVLSQEAQDSLIMSISGIAKHRTFTLRQDTIMKTLRRSESEKEIAGLLGIARSTLHAHLARIYRTLGVHKRADAIMQYFGHSTRRH